MSVADNLARAVAARAMTHDDNLRLKKQLALLTGLYRTAMDGWRAAANERDALAAAANRLAGELEEMTRQCQKEARCAGEMQLRLSRQETAIKDLERRLAQPLMTREKLYDVTVEPLGGTVTRPEDEERERENGDQAF